jgi:uncharacterized protein (DUF1015 family)
MADVYPLHGIRYTPEMVGDLAQVVTPPYDVISPEAQAHYYKINPYNSIRLELGQNTPEDNTLNTRYTRAATTLAEWRQAGILHQDTKPSYYLYQQIFQQGDQTYTRTSLLARVRLEPWSARVVLPHEHTLAKPKDDRLSLLRACSTNFSPIMSMYNDPQGRIRRILNGYAAQAEVHITDEAGEQHLLQPIVDPAQVLLIQDFFAERQLYIADGHHRYETALNYREEIRALRKELAPDDAANFVLMALIDVDDPGMVVLPTHRLFSNLDRQVLQRLNRAELSRYFTVSEPSSEPENALKELEEAGKQKPSFLLTGEKQSWLLSLNDQGQARMAQSEHSVAWQTLDVAIAHTLLVEELLGLSAEDITTGAYVRYTRDPLAAWQVADAGETQVGLLLNPTRVRQICDVAEADDRMPQKSTYFYPKLITGLVLNPLW